MAINIERKFAMTTKNTEVTVEETTEVTTEVTTENTTENGIVLLSENTTEVTVEEKEAKLTGAIVLHLVQFVLSQETRADKKLAASVIKKAFMHENTSWDNLGHRKWGIPETGRSGQIKFFEKYLAANGLKL